MFCPLREQNEIQDDYLAWSNFLSDKSSISSRQVHYSDESKGRQIICHNYISHSAETQTQPCTLLYVDIVLLKVCVFIIHLK